MTTRQEVVGRVIRDQLMRAGYARHEEEQMMVWVDDGFYYDEMAEEILQKLNAFDQKRIDAHKPRETT